MPTRSARPAYRLRPIARVSWRSSPPLLDRVLVQVAVEQILGVLHAPELQDLRVPLDASVERHAHLPRPGEDFRILDDDVVLEVMRAHGSVALDHVKRVAVEVV